ncbi:MAG: hypothetical protein FWG84_05765 [Bacteroidales bacterium]|nr:hypothetical protein [Bacteroidales bacterium]
MGLGCRPFRALALVVGCAGSGSAGSAGSTIGRYPTLVDVRLSALIRKHHEIKALKGRHHLG